MKPAEFIDAVRYLHPNMVDICIMGGCYRFYLLMRNVFPEAEAYYDGGHVAVKLEGKFYDINGRVWDTSKFQPIDPNVASKAHSWAPIDLSDLSKKKRLM